jgi:hypothetical protein
MKRIGIALALVLLFGSALQTMGQAKGGSKATPTASPAAPAKAAAPPAATSLGAALKCTGAGGTSDCTAQQVADLNVGITSGKRRHQPFLMNVKGVTQGKNGTLVCTQDNGSACTDDQLSAIISLASTTNSSGGAIVITKPWDSSSPKFN